MARIISAPPGTLEHAKFHRCASIFFFFVSLGLIGIFLWRIGSAPEEAMGYKLFMLLMLGLSFHALGKALDEYLDARGQIQRIQENE